MAEGTEETHPLEHGKTLTVYAGTSMSLFDDLKVKVEAKGDKN